MVAADDAADSSAPADDSTSWTIALQDEPGNLLPFSPDGRAAAPIVQLLFPPPVLEHGYAYTTTGVLESLPTLENGDVQIATLDGYLDATGQFTVTETTQPTTTQQLIVTFRWSKDLRWADDTPLTAADSVFAYQLYGQVQEPAEAAAVRDMLESYEQVDTWTTRAVFKPGRVEPAYLRAAWPPLPRHRVADLPPDQALDDLQQAPLGYGPYVFESIAPGRLTLRRNDAWPGSASLREQLIFRFYASAEEVRSAVVSGDADVGVIERVPPDLYRFLDQDQANQAATIAYIDGPVYEHLDFNLGDARFQDVRVRRAIAHAINRQRINDDLFGGKATPLHSWILPDQRAFYAGDEQLRRYPYDPARARALLDEAGLIDTDGDGVRELPDGDAFTVHLLTTDTSLRIALAERIIEDLRAIGLAAELQVQPIDQLYSPTGPLYRRNFQLALFAWIASADPGGMPLWSCNAVPSADNGYTGNNFSGWCFEAAEWPLRRANTTLDARARARDYLTHQQLWTQEAPVIPLMQRPIVTLYHPRLSGIAPDPLAPITWNIEQWRYEP